MWCAVDGHDLPGIVQALDDIRGVKKPKLVIADTVKGKGVSFMEHVAMESDAEIYRFHSGAPQAADYTRAAQEIIDRINRSLREARVPELALETIERPAVAAPEQPPERLIPAYSAALLDLAANNDRVVALDADLMLDCGLIPFKERFAERFIECGIAEMDMVSQAGAMARKGLIPICHSFACFLATRANEQIYNNATERSKVVYLAALAGLVPGGPGHSHQSVRDIAALSGTPGLTMLQPSCAAEVEPLLRWAVEANPGSSYLRFVSIPVQVPFTLPDDYRPELGKGWVAKDGGTGPVLFAYGPTLATEAWHALDHLGGGRLVILPWLNRVDPVWLTEVTKDAKSVVAIDDHYRDGGQGTMLVRPCWRAALPAGSANWASTASRLAAPITRCWPITGWTPPGSPAPSIADPTHDWADPARAVRRVRSELGGRREFSSQPAPGDRAAAGIGDRPVPQCRRRAGACGTLAGSRRRDPAAAATDPAPACLVGAQARRVPGPALAGRSRPRPAGSGRRHVPAPVALSPHQRPQRALDPGLPGTAFAGNVRCSRTTLPRAGARAVPRRLGADDRPDAGGGHRTGWLLADACGTGACPAVRCHHSPGRIERRPLGSAGALPAIGAVRLSPRPALAAQEPCAGDRGTCRRPGPDGGVERAPGRLSRTFPCR